MSDPKCYIINFYEEKTTIANIDKQIAKFLLSTPTPILAYWNYLPLVYCVKSYASSRDLTFRLVDAMPGAFFVIAEINVANIDGQLPPAAWDWFYKEVVTQPPLNERVTLADMLRLPSPPKSTEY